MMIYTVTYTAIYMIYIGTYNLQDQHGDLHGDLHADLADWALDKFVISTPSCASGVSPWTTMELDGRCLSSLILVSS